MNMSGENDGCVFLPSSSPSQKKKTPHSVILDTDDKSGATRNNYVIIAWLSFDNR